MRNGLLCLSLFFPLYRVFPLSQNVLWNDSCVFDLWWQWRKQPFLLDFVLVCSQISRILEFCTVLKFSSKNALLLLPLASYVPTLEWEWIGMVPKGNFMLISEALYIFLKRIKWKKNKAGRFSQARAQTHGSCKGSAVSPVCFTGLLWSFHQSKPLQRLHHCTGKWTAAWALFWVSSFLPLNVSCWSGVTAAALFSSWSFK